MFKYEVGDLVEFQANNGIGRWKAKVTKKVDDINYGKPGFEAETEAGGMVWGYDDQILKVFSRQYTVGDTVEFKSPIGVWKAKVTRRLDDIYDGKPGFDAEIEGGGRVWGFDDQVIQVFPQRVQENAPTLGKAAERLIALLVGEQQDEREIDAAFQREGLGKVVNDLRKAVKQKAG